MRLRLPADNEKWTVQAMGQTRLTSLPGVSPRSRTRFHSRCRQHNPPARNACQDPSISFALGTHASTQYRVFRGIAGSPANMFRLLHILGLDALCDQLKSVDNFRKRGGYIPPSRYFVNRFLIRPTDAPFLLYSFYRSYVIFSATYWFLWNLSVLMKYRSDFVDRLWITSV